MGQRMPSTTEARGIGPLPRLVREASGEERLLGLLRQVELPHAILDDPRLRITLVDMARLFELAAGSLGDGALGLRVGAQMAATDYGAFVRYALAAPNLGLAIARLVRSIAHFQQDGCLYLEPIGPKLRFGYRAPIYGAAFARHHADHVIGPLTDFVRAYLGPDWRPDAIEVPYGRDEHRRALDRFFGVPVRWSQPGVAILLSPDALAAAHARQAIAPLARGELRELVRRPRRPRMRDLVAEIVALRLHDGRADLDGVAAKLGMHRRALQRALAEEDATYREVVAGVLRSYAEQELLAGDRPIADLAFALGFSEPQHFTRAFRRWTGVPPSARRADRHGT